MEDENKEEQDNNNQNVIEINKDQNEIANIEEENLDNNNAEEIQINNEENQEEIEINK